MRNWLLRKAMGMVYMQAVPGDGVPGAGGGAAPTGAAALIATPAAAPTGTPAAPALGTAPAAGAGAAAEPWYGGFKNEEVKTWLKSFDSKNFPDAESIALKALNQERLLGAGASAIIPPKADAKPEEKAAFWKKIGGVPDTPAQYELPAAMDPQIKEALSTDPMVAKFREAAHKAGMPPHFFQAAVDWYHTETSATVEAKVKELEGVAERDISSLRTEWGKDYDKNIELGRRGVMQFVPGKDGDERQSFINKMESVLGTGATLRFFSKIGGGLGEHEYIANGGSGGMAATTVEGARAKIAQLKGDPTFSAKLLNQDAESKAEWDRLHKVAYPEPK